MVTIKVFANPYQYLDPALGPQAVVGVEGARDAWVGAQLNLEDTAKRGGKHAFDFDATADGKLRVQTVPLTSFYLREVWAGDLVAADAESARLCGLSEKEFVDALKFLDDARARAEADWAARYAHPGNAHGSPPAPLKLRTFYRPRKGEAEAAAPAAAAAEPVKHSRGSKP